MSKTKRLALWIIVLGYIVSAILGYLWLPFLEAATLDGALMVVVFILGIFLYQGENEHEGAWGYVEDQRKWIEEVRKRDGPAGGEPPPS